MTGQSFGQVPANEPLNDAFSAYDAIGGTTVGATAVTVPLTVEHIPSSVSFDLSGNEVTLSAGAYEITFGCTLMVTTSARTQGQAWLEKNGVEVPGTRVALYCRQSNHGATGTAQIFFSVSASDTLRIRAQRTAGSGTLTCLANGSRLALRRL